MYYYYYYYWHSWELAEVLSRSLYKGLMTQHVRASQAQVNGQRPFHFYRPEPFLNIVTNTTNIRLDKIKHLKSVSLK